MKTEDLRLISTLGQALYANPAQAQTRSLETVAAISTLSETSEDQFLERALGLMLHQAERDGLKANVSGVASPFFRLSPKERFVLFLLHSGRASYARLSRLLGVSVQEVQTLAWIARTQIAASPEFRLQTAQAVTPPPPPTKLQTQLRQSCPEYDATKPWTQKILDDEMASAELTFIQNHTAICTDCNRALRVARDFYYSIERLVPTVPRTTEDGVDLGAEFEKALRKGRIKSGDLPADLSFIEAFGVFISHKENLFWLAALLAMLFALSYAKSKVV